MVNDLPFIHRFTVAPIKEDLDGINVESTDEHLLNNYLKPYFSKIDEQDLAAITLNQIFTPGNTPIKISFKVIALEPAVNLELDPTGSQANEMQGGVVDPEHLDQVFIADPVPGSEVDAVRFEDIGGLDEPIKLIREYIELPIKHPQLFKALGIKPTRGVLISGPPGTGKTMIGKALAHEVDAFFLLINGPEIMSKMAGESESNLRKAFEEAEKNAPAIIFIDELDSIAPKREKAQGEVEKRVVAQLLVLMDGVKPTSNVFVIGATNRANELDTALRRFGRFTNEIAIGTTNEDGRKQILKIHTRNMKLADNINFDEIIQDTQGFTGADLAQLCHEAAMQVFNKHTHLLLNTEEGGLSEEFLNSLSISNDDFRGALKNINPSSLREAHVEIPNVSWDDVGGLKNVKKNLTELIQWPIIYRDVMNKFGLEPSSGVLFYGPPGCGKTLMAKAIATECKANFISIKGPELLTMWYGESESNVRDIFSKARHASPCVLFFDEIDSIASSRGSGAGDNNVTDRVINTILTEMDGMTRKNNVFVIGATNRPELLDSALLRPGRLDQVVYISPPDKESRLQIIKIALANTPVSDGFSPLEIAENTEGFSGADITEICRSAVRNAVREYMTVKDAAAKQNAKDDGEEMGEIEMEALVTRDNFVAAMKSARKSIKDSDLKRYQVFAEKISSSGVNLPQEFQENFAGTGNDVAMENDAGLYD